MISKELIQNRIDNFWGYGNLGGKYWFIGMEEGHDLDSNALEIRFNETFNKSTVDIIEGMPSIIKHLKWFKPPFPPVQRTYKGYIIIKLFIELGRMPSIEEIRLFQLNQLGREFVDGRANDHSILELMPLPASSTSENDWLYKDFGIDDLSTRKKYLRKYKPIQIKKLRNLIKKHNPKLVVFYSIIYLKDWESVANCDLIKIQKKQYIGSNGKTLFCVLPHPVARGVSNKDWNCWGQEIYNRLLGL